MLQYLQRGRVLENLGAEIIFSAVFTLALFIVVHAVLSFVHSSIPGKLEPLQADFRLIQAYYARLRHVERKSIEAEMEAAKEEESEKDGRIQRQRLGLDRFI